ncbi:MAG: sulfate reduction electron transfer complex DsrMKJOP subunit DsrJ [Acidobacteriota bacterium]|nr:sulfate reduction electron transfer complex DsrMKJOP subunit DsrJ [Acidobacteriota bacterium]
MRDRIWIIAGLALFAAAVTAPFWCERTPAKDLTKVPNLVLPANQKECVAPVSYMRASHMLLLLRWREDVVRSGQRRYVAFNGKVYDKSLTKTCLGCHNKEQFCDRCHTYAGVSGPYCWNCHNQPQTNVAGLVPRSMP